MSTKDLGSMSNAELGQLFNIDLGNDILDMQKDEDGSFNYEPPQLALPAPAPASIATAPPAPSPAPYVPEPLAATNVQTIAPEPNPSSPRRRLVCFPRPSVLAWEWPEEWPEVWRPLKAQRR